MRRATGVILAGLLLSGLFVSAAFAEEGISFDLGVEGCLEVDSVDPATISLEMVNLGDQPLDMTVMFQNRSEASEPDGDEYPWYSLQVFTVAAGESATASFAILPETLGPVGDYRYWILKAWVGQPFVGANLVFVDGYVFIPECPDTTVEASIHANLSFGGLALMGFEDGQVVVVINPGSPDEWFATVDSQGGYAEIQPEQIGFAIEPGMVITAGDRELVIPAGLTFDTFDVDGNRVAGVAPYGPVSVAINGVCGVEAPVIDGAWSVDVTVECSGVQLEGDMSVDVSILDEDGDETLVSWMRPRFTVSLEGSVNADDVIEGSGWPYGTEVLIRVEDELGDLVLETTTVVDGLMTYNGDQGPYDVFRDSSSFLFYEFDEIYGGDFRFQPGWTVTVRPVEPADPLLTKTLTVTPLVITGVDLDADVLFGTAAPGSSVVAYGCAVDGEVERWPWGGAWSRRVYADAGGYWEADFSVPGYARFGDDEFLWVVETCDLRGYEFGASQIDGDFDETQRTYLIPQLHADLTSGSIVIYRINTDPKLVEVFDEPGGELLWSEVLEPLREEGNRIEIGGETHGIELQPGMLIRASGAELILADLSVDDFDIDNDAVSGTGPASTTIWVGVEGDGGFCEGNVSVDAGGLWAIRPDALEGEGCEAFDLNKRSRAWAEAADSEGDTTSAAWEQPPLWVKEELVSFIATAETYPVGSFDKALQRLEQSLDPALWVDYRTLDPKHGEMVFTREAQAAQEFEKIDRLVFGDGEETFEVAGSEVAMALFYAVDLPLAEIALAAAVDAGGDPGCIDKANASLDRAFEAIERGDPSAGIVHLGHAWKHAQRALG